MYLTDMCWEYGLYNDDCICEFCSHNHECSGYENHEEDDFDGSDLDDDSGRE